MVGTKKSKKLFALLEELGEEEGTDGIGWVCARIREGWRTQHKSQFDPYLTPILQERYGVYLAVPCKQITAWYLRDPDRKAAVAQARIDGADAKVEQADEILLGSPDKPINSKKLTNSDIYLMKEQAKHLMSRAAMLNPAKYSEKTQAATAGGKAAGESFGKLHMAALQAAGGFDALKKPDIEPERLPADVDEPEETEADYEILEKEA